MTTELIKRLRGRVFPDAIFNEAADALEAMQRELDAAKAEIERLKVAITPQPLPEGLVTYGKELEPARINADFWYKAGHSEEARLKGESIICMAQAVFAWKNAAYAMAEKKMIAEKELAARDLVIQQMREAARELRGLANHFDNMRMAKIANEALSLQPTTEHLDAYVAEKVKEEREACAKLCEKRGNENRIAEGKQNGDRDEFYCADDIRARSDIAAINALEK